jgi:iron complex outermembrane recepter protein
MSAGTWVREGLLFSIGAAAALSVVPPAVAADTFTDQEPGLAEIIVTAEKRSERLQDVPVPVTVLDANTLAERDENRLQDYFTTVPGLNLASVGAGQTNLAIRGITTGDGTNPTVGVTIDDVPYGASTSQSFGQVLYPDIDPGNLSSVEVLRGPQGTLYGASSIGGLLKFETVDPSTTGFSGRVQVDGNDVAIPEGGLGYGVRGVINVPLSDTLAIRASAFSRQDPGYIENVTTGQRFTNEVDVDGGRLSALWRPYDSVSLKVSAMLQHTSGYGDGLVQSISSNGTYQEARLRGTGGDNDNLGFYTAKLTVNLLGLDFVSLTGYSDNKYSKTIDLGALAPTFFGPLAQSLYGVSGASDYLVHQTEKVTQEFRLSSPQGQTFEWLLGAFYTHENSPENEQYQAVDPSTGAPVGTIVRFSYPTVFSESALFGDLDVHFSNQFDVQFGGRESENKIVYNETDAGPYVPLEEGYPTPLVYPTGRTNASAFTYLLTPRFKISSDLMVYARFASGYRVGGPNGATVFGSVPSSYDPDKTYNYELGIKGDLIDHALTFDASAYYINWKDIQLQLAVPVTGLVYFANGGNAKSQGLELSLQARPSQGLSITAVASVIDAELTQNLPAQSTAVGYAGDRLPYSSHFSGSLSANQDIRLTSIVTGFVGGSVNYVGAREGEFTTGPPAVRLLLPAYTQMDLRTGARVGSWTTDLFVTNVSNQRGQIGTGFQSLGIAYIRPRTVGVSVAKTF